MRHSLVGWRKTGSDHSPTDKKPNRQLKKHNLEAWPMEEPRQEPRTCLLSSFELTPYFYFSENPVAGQECGGVIERVVELRMAQEAIKLELVSKLEMLQRSVADVAAFVMKINEKREAEIRQPIPQRRVKMAVSKKRPTYPNPEDEEPVEEIPPQEEGSKESPVALESNSGTNFTIPNPPSPTPEETVPPLPPAELVTMKRRFDENPQQQRSEGAVKGQAVMGTQTRERVATHGRAADIDDQTVGQRGHTGGERQDPMSATHHGAGHTEESQFTTVQYGGHRVERLP
ncbi:hypothetical protein ACLOJK_027489 [Asimina triloba]